MTRASPFVIITSAFAAGIWLASQFALPVWFTGAVALLALVTTILLRKQYSSAWGAAFVMLLASGAWWYTVRSPAPTPDAVAAYNGHAVVLEGVVIEEPDARVEYVYLRVQTRRLVVDESIVPASGLVLVRTGRDMPWRYGDVVRAFGVLDAPPVLSEFDYRDYLARKGVLSLMYPQRMQRIGQDQGSPIHAALLDLRAALRLSSQQVMPSPESALLNGILIGDDNEIPLWIQAAFRRTGTSHIVAISGFNVTIVIALVVPVLSRLLNKRRAALVAIPAILVYTVLVGASAPVQRAALMAIIGLFGQLVWRRGFTLNTLCATAFLMLAYEPDTLFDGGFQLSLCATLGLVLYAGRLTGVVQAWLERRFARERAQRWAGVLADVTLTTLAAQLTTLPLLLSNFKQLSLVSPLANALVLPLQPGAMILGMCASVAGLLSVPLGAIVAVPAYALLTATLRVVEWAGALSWATVPVYDFGAPVVIAYYLGLFALSALLSQPASTRHIIAGMVKRNLRAGGAAAAVVALVIGAVYVYQRPDGKLHVTFSGAGAFIQTPAGKQVVFAAGGGVLPVMGRAMPVWERGIELVVLPRHDDIARADTLPLLQRYRVGTLILPAGEDDPSARLDEWTAQARASVTQVISVPMGTRAIIEPGVVLTVVERLGPSYGSAAREAIGLRLSYGDTHFELAGDTGVISGTLGNTDVVFVGVEKGVADVLNAAQPRWVVWADAGGAPARLDRSIHAVALRDVEVVEFISDGKSLTIVQH